MKSHIMKMNELQRTTWAGACALFMALLLVFFCVFRVSNATALVIIVNMAILGSVSLVTKTRGRYLVLVALVGMLALELFFREPSGTASNIWILVRFSATGLLITYFETLLTRKSQELYLDIERLAQQREDALADSRRWLARANALVMVISMISTKSHLHEIFEKSLEETRKVFDADSGLIYTVSSDSGTMSIVGSFGYSDEVMNKMKRRETEGAASCEACKDKDAIVVADDLSAGDKCPSLQNVTIGSCICLPIVSDETILGVLHLRRRRPDAFTPQDIQLAQSMTYQFGLAMQRAALFEQVNRLAITDPITGLYNYRKLRRDIEREIVRAKRYRHPFSFVMADIDHFKALNDRYGHQAGDTVLREVARSLNAGKREVDRAYRYGGEEFSILLPETEWPEAFEVAEKLRKKVAEMRISVDGELAPVETTISMGVASFSHESMGLERLMADADEALYNAKNTGRNKVVAHSVMEEAG